MGVFICILPRCHHSDDKDYRNNKPTNTKRPDGKWTGALSAVSHSRQTDKWQQTEQSGRAKCLRCNSQKLTSQNLTQVLLKVQVCVGLDTRGSVETWKTRKNKKKRINWGCMRSTWTPQSPPSIAQPGKKLFPREARIWVTAGGRAAGDFWTQMEEQAGVGWGTDNGSMRLSPQVWVLQLPSLVWPSLFYHLMVFILC